MEDLFDTIAAPITGSDGAAVAVIRISGPESWDIAALLFEPWPVPVRPRYALYGRFANGDDGLALPFELGASYTGERCVELSVHGSPASVQELMQVCYRAGVRPARPGEFTERAFLNGRIDLTQAEGVRDTVEAETQAQLRQANLLREGALRDEVRSIRESLLSLLATIEASVDFSEEVGELDRNFAATLLEDVDYRLQALLKTADAGRLLRKGLRIAIVGPPNAGKSSLLNALLGFERAIVASSPGTTRDFVEERIDLGGIACVLTDTAGLRESEDEVERIGVERTHRVAAAADRIWYVYDGSAGWSPEDEGAVGRADRPVQVLANKADLPPHPQSKEGALPISAYTMLGLDRLIELVSSELAEPPETTVWVNDRHAPLLREALDQVDRAGQALSADLPADLGVVHLQAALATLGQITGETASEDMIERLFSEFCIGK